jgi:glycosyltransferase involved in cell wall biosynthesis
MRILLLTDQLPNRTSGNAQRTALLHRALLELGEVTTLVIRETQSLQCIAAPAPGVVAEICYPAPGMLRKFGRIPVIDPLVRSVLDLDDFDMVVGRYLAPLAALPKFRGLAVIDADDANYRYPADRGWSPSLLAAGKGWVRHSRSRRVLRRADYVWFCCQRDFDAFSPRSAGILPNAVAYSDITPESVVASEPMVLMVGSMWYRPNQDAAEAFLKCWPEIRRLAPGARFRIVGDVSADQRQRWTSAPGVECPGFVDDLAAEYRSARVTVAPIRSGGGTQIKALAEHRSLRPSWRRASPRT